MLGRDGRGVKRQKADMVIVWLPLADKSTGLGSEKHCGLGSNTWDNSGTLVTKALTFFK